VNAAEADARRKERFIESTGPFGRVSVPEEEVNPIFPMTLDMRLPSSKQKAGIIEQGLVS
jgi:uncharacterized protein (DUF2126 family)